jgi:hypothetical protein
VRIFIGAAMVVHRRAFWRRGVDRRRRTIMEGAETVLADIIIARSAYGGDRNRDDLHRHATFSCGIRRFYRRLMRVFRA